VKHLVGRATKQRQLLENNTLLEDANVVTRRKFSVDISFVCCANSQPRFECRRNPAFHKNSAGVHMRLTYASRISSLLFSESAKVNAELQELESHKDLPSDKKISQYRKNKEEIAQLTNSKAARPPPSHTPFFRMLLTFSPTTACNGSGVDVFVVRMSKISPDTIFHLSGILSHSTIATDPALADCFGF